MYGGRITTAILRDATHWDDAVQAIGLEYLRRHDLRPTGLTWRADAGVPVHHLRKIAGHGSLSPTQRYLHPVSTGAPDGRGNNTPRFTHTVRSRLVGVALVEYPRGNAPGTRGHMNGAFLAAADLTDANLIGAELRDAHPPAGALTEEHLPSARYRPDGSPGGATTSEER